MRIVSLRKFAREAQDLTEAVLISHDNVVLGHFVPTGLDGRITMTNKPPVDLKFPESAPNPTQSFSEHALIETPAEAAKVQRQVTAERAWGVAADGSIPKPSQRKKR